MPKFMIQVERKTVEVFAIEARSGAEAAFQLAIDIAQDKAVPVRAAEIGRKVSQPRQEVADPRATPVV